MIADSPKKIFGGSKLFLGESHLRGNHFLSGKLT